MYLYTSYKVQGTLYKVRSTSYIHSTYKYIVHVHTYYVLCTYIHTVHMYEYRLALYTGKAGTREKVVLLLRTLYIVLCTMYIGTSTRYLYKVQGTRSSTTVVLVLALLVHRTSYVQHTTYRYYRYVLCTYVHSTMYIVHRTSSCH